MTEFHALRFLLGCCCVAVAAKVWRYRLGALAVFGLALAVEAVANLIPMMRDDPDWWRWVWLPLAAFRLQLALFVSQDLFAFLRARTHQSERSAILGASVAAGSFAVIAAWVWHPANWFQMFTIARQYMLLALAVGTSAAWYYVRSWRPIPIADLTRAHGSLWCIWLWVVFGASTTAQGGLLWRLVDWHGGDWYWRMVSCGAMLAQGGLLGMWFVSLPDLRLRRVERKAA